MDVDKGSGLSQTVLFSVVLFPLVAFVNNLLRPIDPINQNVQRWLRMDHQLRFDFDSTVVRRPFDYLLCPRPVRAEVLSDDARLTSDDIYRLSDRYIEHKSRTERPRN